MAMQPNDFNGFRDPFGASRAHQYNSIAYGLTFTTSSIFKIANGNGRGNILQSWAVLTNPSRVAFRDETSTAAILLSRRNKLPEFNHLVRAGRPSD